MITVFKISGVLFYYVQCYAKNDKEIFKNHIFILKINSCFLYVSFYKTMNYV